MTKEQLLSTFKEYCTKMVKEYTANKASGEKSEGGILDTIKNFAGLKDLGDTDKFVKQLKGKAEEMIKSSDLKKDDVWDEIKEIAISSAKDLFKKAN